jgi:hypothetical protein
MPGSTPMYSPAGPQPGRWYCLWRSVRAQPPRPPAPRRGYSPSAAGATVRTTRNFNEESTHTGQHCQWQPGTGRLGDRASDGPKSLSGTVRALRHSKLAPCSFQYTSSLRLSTPPGFSTEIQSDKVSSSVRNFSTTETENHRLAFKRHPLIFNRHCRSTGSLSRACSVHAPHSVCTVVGRPPGPFDRQPARLSDRGPPQPAPELCARDATLRGWA